MTTLFIGFGYSVPTAKQHYAKSLGECTQYGNLAMRARLAFREKVQSAVERSGFEVLFLGNGTGQWEGQSEPAGAITAMGDGDIDQLVAALTFLATRYHQDSIALTIVPSSETKLLG